MLAFYDFLAALVAGAVLGPIARARRILGRISEAELRGRSGRVSPPASKARPRIVLHAVSAGEMAVAGAIAESLARIEPGAAVHLTAGNADGVAAGERLRARIPAVASVGFLPWDRRTLVERWLAALDPDAVAVVETEIWPNLFRACARAGVPLLVVNGRVPDRDLARYRLGRVFFRRVLADVRGVLARSAEDARRFVAIGAPAERVRDAGDVKFDAAAASAADRGPSGRSGPVVVAGSTHAPEERLLLSACAALRNDFPDLSLVIAPRRVRRAAAIVRRARAAGFCAALASGAEAAAAVRVLDAIGGLRDLYAGGEIAFVGGTFSARGGHSPLEAAARGCALLIGPRPGSFRDAVAGLEAAGAAERALRREDLAPSLRALLSDAGRRQDLGRRARAFAESGRGAAARCAGEIAAAARERLAVSAREAREASLPSDSEGTGT